MDYKTNKKAMLEDYYFRSKKHGLKITPQRTAIYQELLKAKDHPSADIIYKRLIKRVPNISFDTVNRTLLTFSKIGIANIVEGYGQPKRYDPSVDTHHHCRCIHCDAIIDFHNEAYDELTVPKEIQEKFSVLNKKIVLEGLCDRCKKKRFKKEVSP